MSRHPTFLSLGLVALAVVALSTPAAEAVAPAGKHYAGVLVVIEPDTGEIDAAPVCVVFTRDHQLCTEAGDCGTWQMTERKGRQNEWTLRIKYVNDDGQTIKARGTGLTERGGPGSSVAGTLLLTLDGVELNAAFAGVRMSAARCMEYGTQDD